MSDLQTTFYIMGIVYMGVMFILIIMLVVTALVIRSKVIAIHDMISEKIDNIGKVVDTVKEVTKVGKKIFSKE